MLSANDRQPMFEVFEPRLFLCNGPAAGAGMAASVMGVIESLGGVMSGMPGGFHHKRAPIDMRHVTTDKFRDYGNTVADANPVELKAARSVSVRGTIGYAGDVDMFVVSAPQAGVVNLTIDADGWGNKLLAQTTVYDDAGKVLASVAQAKKGKDVHVGFNVAAGKTYYVEMASKNGALGRYDMDLFFVRGPANHAPVAQSDAYTMDENGTLAPSTSLLAIATDADGDALEALLVSAPSYGTLVLNADGMFTYKPATDFTGTDSFTYKVNDGQADSNVATIMITVNPVNQAPVAQDDGYSVDQDNVLTASVTALNACAIAAGTPTAPVGVLNNDTDPNGDPLTSVLVGGPANGTLAFNADGTFTYTPNAGWSGTDSFTYRASDGQADSNVATVMITVQPAAPTPVARDDFYTVIANGTLNVSGKGVLANDANPTGDMLFVMLTGDVQHGLLYLDAVGSFMYIPNSGFTGIDTFTYVASGMNGMSDPATVTINVV
jgi:VCBS repeat-containing protein